MKKTNTKQNIPDGWKSTQLSSIGTFSKGAGILKNQLTEVGHNAVRYGELYTKFDYKIKKIHSFIPDEVVPLAKEIQYGDILFAGSGETIDEIGKSAAYLLKEKGYAGGDIIILRPKKDDSLYLAYFLNKGEARKKLRELGAGQSVVHIYKSDIEKMDVCIPPLPEQKRIVLVLETWDQAIEKLKRKIEIKKEVKKGLMQELLTGKTRLSGFIEKWEIIPLAKIAQINPKVNSLPDKFIYVDLESVTKGNLIKERQIELDGAPSRAQRLLKEGDVIFQTVRPYQMNNLYFDKTGNYVASTGYAQLRSYKDSRFLFYILHTDRFVNDVLNRCTGSNYPAINSTDLGEIELKVPRGSGEQSAIADILITADTEIKTLEKKLRTIKDQKKYLLNNLVTGEIRTPETLSILK